MATNNLLVPRYKYALLGLEENKGHEILKEQCCRYLANAGAEDAGLTDGNAKTTELIISHNISDI